MEFLVHRQQCLYTKTNTLRPFHLRMIQKPQWYLLSYHHEYTSSPITGLDRPRGFQELEATTFRDNRHMQVVRLSALRTGLLYTPGNIPGTHFCCRSQWPSGLRRRSAATRLLRLWVRIPRGARMSVCCECCVMSGRGLCDELITRPEESYRLWCIVCDLETS